MGLLLPRNRIAEALSQIDVQLKRRTDLIPNLVETVKGFAKHEKELLENVTKDANKPDDSGFKLNEKAKLIICLQIP